ncbi:MAG TPA: hypothetical protein DC049_03980, partial [Spirochaetia bacterium]|nr:hypothetical protein [Spirochaetia bacterium]
DTNTNIAIKPDISRVFLTFTPLSFNSAARAGIKIDSLLCGGFNGGITANSNFFDYNYGNVKLETRTVNFSVSSLLPKTAKQGASAVQAMKIAIFADDADISLALNSLTFSIAGENISTNDLGNCTLYQDNGKITGSFDAEDSIVNGATGIFLDNKMTLSFVSPVTVTSAVKTLFLLVNIGENATVGKSFKIRLAKNNQHGFSPLLAGSSSFPILVNDYSPDTTEECAIELGIVFTEEPVVVASTIVRPLQGGAVSFYLDSKADSSKYTIYIYDVLGGKIREMRFENGAKVLKWDGKDRKNSYVPAGMYYAIIKGERSEKRIKVMILK